MTDVLEGAAPGAAAGMAGGPEAAPPAGEACAHTAVACLAAVAQFHEIDISARRILHIHALGDAEPSTTELLRIARDVGLKAQSVKATVDSLPDFARTFPALARLRNGNTIIIVGVREDETGRRIGVVDPLAEHMHPFPVTPEQLAGRWDGELVLLKRSWRLTDENQPFSLRWFVPEILREKALFRKVALAAVALHVLALASPIFFQLVIDKVLVHETYHSLYVLTGGVVVALLFDATFQFLRQFLLLFATQRIDIRLARRTFSHLLRLPLTFFERGSAGVTVRHMQQVDRIRQFLTGRLFLTMLDATALLLFVPIMFMYSVPLSFVALGFAALVALVVVLLLGPLRRRLTSLYQAEAQRQAMLVEAVHGMRTVKSLAIEPIQQKKWERCAADAVGMHFRVGRLGAVAGAATGFLEKLMVIAAIAIGAQLVFDGNLTIGALIAFQMLATRVVSPLVQMVSLAQDYQEAALSVRMLGEVMNHPVERGSGGGGLAPDFRGDIAFDGVSFAYAGSTTPALDDVSLRVPAGSVVGIVGRSGSGKSTLARLIQSLHPPQEGLIRIDGIDLRELNLGHYRRNLGVVLQESFLFRGTVRENIASTAPTASFERIVEAARVAGALEFIERLPQGFDTMLEEGASNLSGGQRQRLSIARALVAEPRFLILDEATSALDPDSEAIFLDNLERMAAGRTVLIISHRLSTLVDSDFIVVLEQGRIADVGPHVDLLGRCEVYRQLWNQQNRT